MRNGKQLEGDVEVNLAQAGSGHESCHHRVRPTRYHEHPAGPAGPASRHEGSRYPNTPGTHKPPEPGVNLDCLLQGAINIPQEAEPRFLDSDRHRGGAPPSGLTAGSSVPHPSDGSLAARRACVRSPRFVRRCPHVPAGNAPAAAPDAAVLPVFLETPDSARRHNPRT